MNKKEQKTIDDLIAMYFNNLDNIYNACETTAKNYNSQSIPLNFLKQTIKIVKDGILKGLNQQTKK